MLDLPLHIALAGDAFFGCYLFSMVGMARRVSPPNMRKSAKAKDEGIILIVFITLCAVALSLGSISCFCMRLKNRIHFTSCSR